MSSYVPATEPSGYAPGQGSRRRSTNGLAVAALILGLAGFLGITILVNLILAPVALVRTRRRGDKGTALAAIGLVLSILWAVGGGVAVAQLMKSPDPKRDASGQISTPQKAGVDKLRVGDCVARQTGTVTDVQAQPCGDTGSDKVFAVFALPKGAWPGETASGAAAEKGCTLRYQKTHKRATGRYELLYFAPTKTRWDLGYRRVVCLVGTGS
ncbi:DUF4190 domain-containing protein [Actinomadura sp. DC4]|uniref:DUF4190 domain-containing protein n=1 Tax=Actinomadura sp. DC4 TaxID=3055069 RepID=UPI0025B07BEA|nr:DUF4190 domain-containing protein [Actinomadura sp. DC4]MDN3355984.1 DUF4190 domain-containing protein [Actinomadura sp. DC4]